MFSHWGDVTWIYFCCGQNDIRSPAPRPGLDHSREKAPSVHSSRGGRWEDQGRYEFSRAVLDPGALLSESAALPV